jgi:hypothetical protein
MNHAGKLLQNRVNLLAAPTGWCLPGNLQARYDLEVERERLGAALDRIQPLASA